MQIGLKTYINTLYIYMLQRNYTRIQTCPTDEGGLTALALVVISPCTSRKVDNLT